MNNQILNERIQRQSPVDNRRHGQFRQRRVASLSCPRPQGDPHLLEGREEAGRHAAHAAEPEGEVLHRECSQPRERRHRDGRSGLCVLGCGVEAGPELRVLPDGGCEDQCGGHQQCAPVRGRARGEECGCALHGQGCLPDQRDGHQQGDDGEGGDSQRTRARRGSGDDYLLHEVRQRDGLPGIGDPAVGRADDGGQAYNDN